MGRSCNEGERVYGTTTLAWVTWLACWSRITGLTIERVSSLSSVAFLAADCILLYLLMFRLTRLRWLSAIAAGMLLFSPFFLLISTVGMETMFYSFFILLSFYCYLCEKNFLAGIVAGCAFCTRPDGLAVFAALFVVETAEHWLSSRDRSISTLIRSSLRGGPGRLAIGFLLVAIPFTLLCYSVTVHALGINEGVG